MHRGSTWETRYPITVDYDSESQIDSVEELIEWVYRRADDYRSKLSDKNIDWIDFDPDAIGGLFTVQTSVSFQEVDGFFTQAGTAPNYFGNTWSFATCRWMHRGHDEGNGGWNFDQFFSESPQESDILRPHQPTLVITAANSQHLLGRSRRPIASVAFVTHGFWTVEAYADYLIENCNERATGYRLTHDTESEYHTEAISFGDCHSDRNGYVDEPPEGHDHHAGTESACGCGPSLAPHKDTASDHIKCVSLPSFWHAFADQPKLEATNWGDRGVKYIRGEEGLRNHLTGFGLV